MGGHHEPDSPALNLLHAVRGAVNPSCLARRCSKQDCSLPLSKNLRPFVLVDLDDPGSPATAGVTKCDYLFFGAAASDRLKFAPIELKGGNPQANVAVPQLRTGARIAERLVPSGADVLFQPVVGYGGELRKVQARRFLDPRNRIGFRGRAMLPRLLRCGQALGLAFQSVSDDSRSGAAQNDGEEHESSNRVRGRSVR